MLFAISLVIVACDEDPAPMEQPTYQEEFTIMSGKVYFPEYSQTKTVKTLSQDIKEITVVESPQGWSVEIDEQGNINITSPAQGDVSAESEGYVVIKASGKGGKIIEGRFIVAKGNLEVYAYANRAYFIGGSCDYYYGASTLGGFERSVDYILSVLSMEKGTERSSLLENLSIEKILEEDPDYLFIVQRGDDTAGMKAYVETMMQENPAWQQLTAVQEGRLYFMDKNLYNLKPNHRWGEAYEKLGEILENG